MQLLVYIFHLPHLVAAEIYYFKVGVQHVKVVMEKGINFKM